MQCVGLFLWICHCQWSKLMMSKTKQISGFALGLKWIQAISAEGGSGVDVDVETESQRCLSRL